MDVVMPQRRKWTRAEFERLVEQGAFQPGERVELLQGEILAMTPQKGPHATAVGLVQDALGRWPGGAHVRIQSPLAFDPDSEPEPDAAVVAGQRRDYADRHPGTALLVVEVADTSLAYDRQIKGPLYAQAGIPEYWVVNLLGRQVEVYREAGERDGCWEYRLVRRHGGGDVISPLLAPELTLRVADLLP